MAVQQGRERSSIRYRSFGTTGWQVSALGLGIGRLDPVDEAGSISILRRAVDRGVNYVDVSAADDSEQCEQMLRLVSSALRDGYRSRVRIADGVTSRAINSLSDCERYLGTRLRRLEEDTIDFFLLRGLDRDSWPRLEGIGVLTWAEKAIVAGRIGRLGFSFHDDFQCLRTILDSYDKWAVAEFQYSFMDFDHHPGLTGLQLARTRGLGVVVSQALLDGRLTINLPETVAALWDSTGEQRHAAEWGLRWVWNHPEVSTVVLNMDSVQQVEAYTSLAGQAGPGDLTIAEEVLISRVRDAYRRLRPVPCTACRSCMPCPAAINIPRVFELYDEAIMYGDATIPRALYRAERHRIADCNECGICTGRCGMMIAIPEKLRDALRLLEE